MRHLCVTTSASVDELADFICSLLPEVAVDDPSEAAEFRDGFCILACGELRHSARGEVWVRFLA